MMVRMILLLTDDGLRLLMRLTADGLGLRLHSIKCRLLRVLMMLPLLLKDGLGLLILLQLILMILPPTGVLLRLRDGRTGSVTAGTAQFLRVHLIRDI